MITFLPFITQCSLLLKSVFHQLYSDDMSHLKDYKFVCHSAQPLDHWKFKGFLLNFLFKVFCCFLVASYQQLLRPLPFKLGISESQRAMCTKVMHTLSGDTSESGQQQSPWASAWRICWSVAFGVRPWWHHLGAHGCSYFIVSSPLWSG